MIACTISHVVLLNPYNPLFVLSFALCNFFFFFLLLPLQFQVFGFPRPCISLLLFELLLLLLFVLALKCVFSLALHKIQVEDLVRIFALLRIFKSLVKPFQGVSTIDLSRTNYVLYFTRLAIRVSDGGEKSKDFVDCLEEYVANHHATELASILATMF